MEISATHVAWEELYVMLHMLCTCVFVKTAVNWGASSQREPSIPLYDLQFEDLSILERRTSSDVQSAAGQLVIFTV